METEPGPFQSQPEAPQQMCCQAQPAQRFVCPCKDLTGDVMGHWKKPFRDVWCTLAATDVGLRH